MGKSVAFDEVAVMVDSRRDNVALAKRALPEGLTITREGADPIRLCAPVRRAWRFALREIEAGAPVLQYGWPIGLSKGILAGAAVSAENIENSRAEGASAEAARAGRAAYQAPGTSGLPATFAGYARPDGRVGTRNWILIVPNSMCASHEASQIALRAEAALWSRETFPHVDGVTAIPHDKGCGCTDGSNVDLILHTLAQYAAHPNVGAAVVVELGCEKTNLQAMQRHLGKSLDQWGKPVAALSIQKLGGTEATVQAGLQAVERFLPEANRARRTEQSVRHLVLGLKCGGSDAFSGLTANPALGHASDLLVAQGGTSLFTEVTEMAGCEELLKAQAASPAAAREIEEAIRWYERYAARYGHSAFENPSPGNREGGLVNILVKSLGAVAKAGHAPIQGVTPHAVPPRGPGLWIMQGPSYDQLSTPALVAAGAQAVIFTTGRGTTIGNAIAPVIKIASNSETHRRMAGDLDLNAGTILDGAETHADVGRRIHAELLAIASGRPAKAERNRHREFQIWSEQSIAM